MSQSNETGVVPPMPARSAWLRRAIWARWILLGCYIAATSVWFYFALVPDNPFDLQGASGTFLAFLILSAGVFGLQFLLLLGAPQVHWPRPRRRRSIYVSLIAGAAIAMLLSIGVGCALSSLYKLIKEPEAFRSSFTNVSIRPANAPVPPPPPFNWQTDVPWTVIAIMVAGWTFWFLIFALVGGGEWPRRFGRMYRMLIAGTVLELLITIPIDVQVRKRTNCYCGEGTFFSLIIGLTAILWVFGPGIAILFFIRHRQRLEQGGCCLQCGYNLHGLTSDRCPECGRPFRHAIA